MTQRKFPRIEIDQRAYDALQAEGILRHKTVREIATEAILASISKEAIELTDSKTSESLTSHFKDIATFGSDQNEGVGLAHDFSPLEPNFEYY